MAEENGKDKDDKVDLGQLTEALKGLPEGVQTAVKDAIREASGEQRAVAQAAAAAAAAAAKAAEDDNDDDLDPDFDVERSSRTDLVKHIDRRFEKSLAKALKPIIDRLETTSTDVETDRVRREFGEAKSKHSDFMEWKDEMREIITAHPDLSAERIYQLARAENPDKVKEVDKKIKEEKSKKDGGENKVVEMRAFGGLASTSGSSVENDGKKQPKEAAKSAWEEVMGSVPDSLFGEALEG